jgi:hypothetical protein
MNVKNSILSYTGETSQDISTKLLNSVRIGELSGKIATGINNVFIGFQSGYESKTNNSCVFLGSNSGKNSSNGDYNTLIGTSTGENMYDGSYNTLSGYLAGSNIENGSYNTIVGYNTAINNKNGDYNCILGISSGLNMIESKKNVIIGSENTNYLKNGNSNIFIGNNLDTIDIINDNSIVIGNNTKIREDSIIIGNENKCDTENNISIGKKITTNSRSKFFDPLNEYDNLILQNGIDRINLKTIKANPIKNNLIYKPLEKLTKNSFENNINIKNENYIISRYNSGYKNTEEDEINIIQHDIISLNTYKNRINVPYKVFVRKQPKYGKLKKLVYEKNEEIIIDEYNDLELFEDDEIELSTIMYDFISRFSVTLPLKRTIYKEPINITTLYTNSDNTYLYNGFIYTTKGYRIEKDRHILLYENNELSFDTINNVENLNNIYVKNQGNIIINDQKIQIIKLEEFNSEEYDEELYIMFKSITSNVIEMEHNLIFNERIYIEKPLEYGYFNKTNIIENINDIKYIPKTEEYNNDEIRIRLLKNNKISNKSYIIKIYNYIYRLPIYPIFNSVSPINLSYELPTNFINDGYILQNNIIEHPNKGILGYVESNIEFIDYSHEIEITIKTLIISLVAFGEINIKEEIKIKNLEYIKKKKISIIEKPKYGYIENDIYYNTENVSDVCKIMISTGEYDMNNNNIITIIINIENEFNLIYADQYIYQDYDTLNSIYTNDIYLTSNNITKNINEIQIEEGKYDYIVTFGQKRVLYEDVKIEMNVYKDKYISEMIIGNSIYDVNEIIYELNNNINEDYIISFILNPKPLFDINNFILRVYLDEREIMIKEEDVIMNYDNNIIITKDEIKINENKREIENDIFRELKIKYVLSENNIKRLKNEKYNLINYNVPLFIKNLEILTKNFNEDSYNLNIGNEITTLGINNICIGKKFNTFGNNSIILGNNIGSTSNITDNGLHESIIIGNDSFKNSLCKNTISIGNNIFNNVTDDDYINISNFFSRNPIIIGNNIEYNENEIINIGDCFIEEEEKIRIGKKNKDIILEGEIKDNVTIKELIERIKKLEELLINGTDK